MKAIQIYNKIFLAACIALGVMSCGEESEGVSPDFMSVSSITNEADASTVTVPFRNSSASFAKDAEVSFAGSAVEGTDYEFVGITEEGVQIKIVNNEVYASNKVLRILLSSKSGLGGNRIHNMTIVADATDCQFAEYVETIWEGTFNGVEIYDPGVDEYGPYHIEFVQDSEDPTIFWMDNFWDSGIEAYVKVDTETGEIYFPEQETPYGVITSEKAEYVYDVCTSEYSYVISTHFSYGGGYSWDYSFYK